MRDGAETGPRSDFIYNLDCKNGKLVGAIREGDLKLFLRPSSAFSGWYPEPEANYDRVETMGNVSSPALYNITADPNETVDLFSKLKKEAKRLEAKLGKQVRLMVPSQSPDDEPRGIPSQQEPKGTYSPGWCTAPAWNQPDTGTPCSSCHCDVANT
ncbi:arylsulfatase J-like [Dermacentor albipictus]|uniref:arylsulfatase J-like n=1 Tax=Dermacentor albipictus TaxID=60249 RepID=UPI0038FCBFEF